MVSAAVQRYNRSPLHTACKQRYAVSEHGRAKTKTYNAARMASPQGRAIRAAVQARRRARRVSQVCTCCTPAQIADIYIFAQMFEQEVDHKTALALGGLHCANNLQVLSPAEHSEKTIADRQLIARARRAG